MKFTIFLLTISLLVSCTNEPLKPYNLDKTAIENTQKTYENSTIQHQKVQSKSIITITKNETKVLAMIEIFQNWELDSLEKRFEPIVEEAKAKLTYFDGYCEVTFCISEILRNHKQDQYQLMESMLSNPMYESSIDLGDIKTIPIQVDLNNVKFNNKNCPTFTRRHGTIFESKANRDDIIILKITDSDSYSKKDHGKLYKFSFTHSILTNADIVTTLIN